MAVLSPPVFLQAGSHPASTVRRAFLAMLRGRGGIVTPADLAVSQNGTPNMSVNVATGQVGILGSEATYQGVYLCENQGTLNVALAASDPTNPRRDLIIARVRDAAYSGASNTFTIEAVTGTPAGSPADPALPSGSVFVLARVAVAALDTTITNADITDLRLTYAASQHGLMTAAGGTVICTSTTRPAAPFEGMEIFETDTDLKYTYSGSAWVVRYPLGRLGFTQLTANSATFTTIVYMAPVTVTLLPNRKITLRAHANIAANPWGPSVSMGICNNAGTILNQTYVSTVVNGGAESIDVEHFIADSGAGGSTTYKLSFFTSGAAAYVAAAGTSTTYLQVIDEGPA